MLRKPDVSKTTNKRVFVLPVFEVKSNLSPPESKMGLVSMIQSKNAFLFHQRICYQCHLPPKFEDYQYFTLEKDTSLIKHGSHSILALKKSQCLMNVLLRKEEQIK
ncbi:hypothetical protein Avbf_05429 [Armadillidium vulgare]|nr:hypothetical protein Avbf_05429 [Armadillidium vulgare]